MKKLLLFFIPLLFGQIGFAQNSNAVFFSEDGMAFYIIMNGLRQNDQATTNVKVTGLNAERYRVKVIFANEKFGVIDKTIYLEQNTEATYKIKKKKELDVLDSPDKIGNRLAVAVGNKKQTSNGSNGEGENEFYVLRAFSQTPLAAPTTNTTPPPSSAQQFAPAPAPAAAQTTTQTTVTQTTTAAQPASTENSSFSMNVSINGEGGSGNVNVNASESYEEQTTTTTTTSTGTTTAQPGHYEMPGYNGAIGCPWPMSNNDFEGAKKSIRSKSFEDSKLSVAKQIINSNCLTSGQVRTIMSLFSFEDTKLDFAKYAYGYTYDLSNYYKVNDAFEFESSIDELDGYIKNR